MRTTDRIRSFGNSPLPAVIATLHATEVTGTLRVISLTGSRDFLFVDGELRAARSSAEDEKLGSWLVRAGVITEEFKQLALISQEGSDAPPLGHLLVSRSIIESDILEKHLENLALTILRRAAAEPRDACEFSTDQLERQLDTLPKMTTPQLVLIAARAFVDLIPKREALGSPEQVAVRTGDMDDLVQQFTLEMHEAVLLGKLHRDRPIFELRAISGLTDDEFYSATYALEVAGLIRLERRAAVASHDTNGPAAPTAAETEQPSIPREVGAEFQKEREEVKRLGSLVDRLNHYELLGLSSDASYQQVFDAWDNFNARFNPGRIDEPHLKGLGASLKKLHEHGQDAFEDLSSPERRPRYDRIIRTAAEIGAGTSANGVPMSPLEIEAKAREVRGNLNRVDELTRGGDHFSAVRLLERTCDMEPKPEYLLQLARLMIRNPKWASRALEKLRRAVEIDPGFVEGWLEVAEFWRRNQAKERQRKALERALAAEPENDAARTAYRDLMGLPDLQRFLERVKAHRQKQKEKAE